MLLGCCHCGETPSESFPPSDSQSQSLSETINGSSSGSYIACDVCLGGVSPARLKATIMYSGTGTLPCCATYQQTDYTLYPIVGCDYGSAEKPGNMFQFATPPRCDEWLGTDPYRVILQFVNPLLMRLTYSFYNAGSFSQLRYEKTFASGTTINCLESHTLDYVRLNFIAPALPRRWSASSPCTTNTVPETVTVGPA
jgi:hypothetical protein